MGAWLLVTAGSSAVGWHKKQGRRGESWMPHAAELVVDPYFIAEKSMKTSERVTEEWWLAQRRRALAPPARSRRDARRRER